MSKLLVLFLLVLPACASHQLIRREAASYQHQDVNELTKTWGQPTSVVSPDNGYSDYEYGDQAGYTHRYNPKTHGMESIPNGCMTIFTVGPDGTIANWRYYGQDCPNKEEISDAKP